MQRPQYQADADFMAGKVLARVLFFCRRTLVLLQKGVDFGRAYLQVIDYQMLPKIGIQDLMDARGFMPMAAELRRKGGRRRPRERWSEAAGGRKHSPHYRVKKIRLRLGLKLGEATQRPEKRSSAGVFESRLVSPCREGRNSG